MLVVQVNINVKEESVDAFIAATKENVSRSIKEKGIARFDFLQNRDEPTKFILIEAYRYENASAEHKETDHYKKWKSIAEPMMAEPRYRVIFSNILPEDAEY